LGKIAAGLRDVCRERDELGAAAGLCVQRLAAGGDWAVDDVTCTFRPSDPKFEERHDCYRIALVGAGTFHCRAAAGRELLTPGSLLLGNAGACFECGHEHGTGDRCLAFGFAAESFERLAFDAGVRGKAKLRALRIPPLAGLAPLVAEACAHWAAAANGDSALWEDIGVRFAAAAVRLADDPAREPRAPANAEGGVARAVRLIDRDPAAPLALGALCREADLSRFHFVRTFARVTGITPHRYVMRARLRKASVSLATGRTKVVDIALESGFRDVSTFNHAFRAEFGAAPLEYRRRLLPSTRGSSNAARRREIRSDVRTPSAPSRVGARTNTR
jgi:AraC family transcriptional regulator